MSTAPVHMFNMTTRYTCLYDSSSHAGNQVIILSLLIFRTLHWVGFNIQSLWLVHHCPVLLEASSSSLLREQYEFSQKDINTAKRVKFLNETENEVFSIHLHKTSPPPFATQCSGYVIEFGGSVRIF